VYNVRLSPESVTQMQELAEAETEGNASAMIRKLLNEALAVRAGQGRGR